MSCDYASTLKSPRLRWFRRLRLHLNLEVREVQGFHPHGTQNPQCKPKIERAADDALCKRLLRVGSIAGVLKEHSQALGRMVGPKHLKP